MSNETLSYHIYMWNTWNRDECANIFNGDGQEWEYSLGEHIWSKWVDYCNRVGATAAPSLMVANLSEGILNKLIERACTLYDGRKNLT